MSEHAREAIEQIRKCKGLLDSQLEAIIQQAIDASEERVLAPKDARIRKLEAVVVALKQYRSRSSILNRDRLASALAAALPKPEGKA